MKVRIKSGECPSYLTVGKVYEATKLLMLKDDDGDNILIVLHDCPNLKGGSWEIVNE